MDKNPQMETNRYSMMTWQIHYGLYHLLWEKQSYGFVVVVVLGRLCGLWHLSFA